MQIFCESATVESTPTKKYCSRYSSRRCAYLILPKFLGIKSYLWKALKVYWKFTDGECKWLWSWNTVLWSLNTVHKFVTVFIRVVLLFEKSFSHFRGFRWLWIMGEDKRKLHRPPKTKRRSASNWYWCWIGSSYWCGTCCIIIIGKLMVY